MTPKERHHKEQDLVYGREDPRRQPWIEDLGTSPIVWGGPLDGEPLGFEPVETMVQFAPEELVPFIEATDPFIEATDPPSWRPAPETLTYTAEKFGWGDGQGNAYVFRCYVWDRTTASHLIVRPMSVIIGAARLAGGWRPTTT